jgi:tetratricopeptide (TPR) repeat protein
MVVVGGYAAVAQPTTPQATLTATAEEYVEQGNGYYDEGDYEQAIAAYTRAIELSPDNVDAYYNRGNAYFFLLEYERAIANFDHAIVLNPDQALAYRNRGAVYYLQGEYEQALDDLCEYARLAEDRADPQILDLLMELETQLGKECPAE